MKSSSVTILVTDGEHRAALAATRSLGRAGYRVLVASPRPQCLAGASRWAAGRIQVPSPLTSPGDFVTRIAQAVAAEGVAVLLPIADESLLPILDARSACAPAVVPWPDANVVRRLASKAAVAEAAQALGIAVPRQVVLHGPGELLDAAAVTLPVVIKPARSVATGPAGQVKLNVRHASSPAALAKALATLPGVAWPLLIQERIVGPGAGVFVLLGQGEILAAFGHRRLSEKPPSGGVSVRAESVPVSTELLNRSVALLRHFGWDGVAMIEYKFDAATGVPYLMEVNGRLWGSLQLAIDAGVDFPRMLVEHALGRPVTPVTSWTTGIRSRWRLGELDHLIARLRRSAEELSLPPDAPSRWRTILMTLKPAWGSMERAEVFRWDDPRPQLVELLDWLRRR